MKMRRRFSKKANRFIALTLALAMVLANVGVGVQTSYADELSVEQSEEETKGSQTLDGDEEETTELDSEGETMSETTSEGETTLESASAGETTPVLTGTPQETESEGEDGGTQQGTWWSTIAATPANAVTVVVEVEEEGIASANPDTGEYDYNLGDDFTIEVTPEEYYQVTVAVEPESVTYQEKQGTDGTYTYTISDLQENITVTVAAEYLGAVAKYYETAEKVKNFGPVTEENMEEAVALYKELYDTHMNAQRELSSSSPEYKELENSYKTTGKPFESEIAALWKKDASYEGWYLIITHQLKNSPDVLKKEYVYLEKKTPKAASEELHTDDEKLLEYIMESEEYVYANNSLDSIIGKKTTLSNSGLGSAINKPAEVTFYYTDMAGEGWAFDPETLTLILTGNVETVGAEQPWYQLALAGKIRRIYAPGDTRISICDNAFTGNPYSGTLLGIKEVELNNVESIGDRAFAACALLEKATMENIGKIGCGAFTSCGTLSEVRLKNVKQIGEFAEDASMDDSAGAFNGCIKLAKVSLEDVETIGVRSFISCASMTELNMSGVKRIGTEAFYNVANRLKTITIPETCEFIGANAFSIDLKRFKIASVALESIQLPKNDSLILGYSNVFSKMPELIARMAGLWEKTFQLNPITTPELSISAGWDDSKVGTQNSTEPNTTQMTKAARWSDDDKTKAEVELQFSHSTAPGKDILFLLDYSRSIAYPANYKDSKLFNIQIKTIDLIEDLFADGYDNRVGVITFGGPTNPKLGMDGSLGTVGKNAGGFTDDTDELIDFVSHGYSYEESTSYIKAFENAKEMIESRTDSSREVEIIFISDGVPFIDGKVLPFEGEVKDAVDAVKALPDVEIFSVLQADQTTADAEEAMMRQIASDTGYYFRAEDTETFNEAVNAAIAAAYGMYTVTDTVGADFDLDRASVVARRYDADGTVSVLSDEMSSVSFGEDGEGNDVITWSFPALANTRYTLTFTENLKPNSEGKYPFGAVNTNTGYADVASYGADQAINTVETPQLKRAGYQIKVHYVDRETNETLADDGIYSGSENEGYDISELLNRSIDGYQSDGYQIADGRIPQAQGVLTEDMEITVYYVRSSEPVDPEPEESQPTEPQPTEPQPSEPQPTEPQPTEPQPSEPQPTEPQPTEPQPTEPQPTESQPSEPQPSESQPTESQPAETQPTEPAPSNPGTPGGGGTTGGGTTGGVTGVTGVPANPTTVPGAVTAIPNNETPLGAAPIEIENEAVPLADGATLTVIEDEEVPLAAVPETGDERPVGAAAPLAVLSLGMMGMFGALGFRKKENE